jgi:hypothetical protein
LIVFLVVFAGDAFGYTGNVVSVFGTGFALVGELVPDRGQFRARLATTRRPIYNRFVSGTSFAQFVD